METRVLKYVHQGQISFFLARTGKTFLVGCFTADDTLQRSRHRSQSAAEKSLNDFINEWNTLKGSNHVN